MTAERPGAGLNIARQLGLPTVRACVAAAVASSVLTFLLLMITGWIGPLTGPNFLLEIAVILSIILLWGPAIALVPAAILGFFVGRPLSRSLIARRSGGFAKLLLAMVVAAVLLWLVVRIVMILIEPAAALIDYDSLTVFVIIGICSAISWWFLVVLRGRRG